MSSAPAAVAVAIDRGPDFCEAHLERTGEKLPAYRLGLCRDCWAGQPIGARIPGISQSLSLRKKKAELMRARRKDPEFVRRWREAMHRRRWGVKPEAES